jgi:hypothetical protein
MTVDRERTWLLLRVQSLQSVQDPRETGAVVVGAVAAHDILLVVESRLPHVHATS